MVKVANEKFKIGVGETPTSAADLLIASVQTPPQGGFSVDEIKARLRIHTAAELANKNEAAAIELEDADFNKARECVGAMRWGVVDAGIIKFVELFDL